MNDQYLKFIEEQLAQGLGHQDIIDNAGNQYGDEAAAFVAAELKKKEPTPQGGGQASSWDPSSQGYPGSDSQARELTFPEGKSTIDLLDSLAAEPKPQEGLGEELEGKIDEEAAALEKERDQLTKEQGEYAKKRIEEAQPGKQLRETIFELLGGGNKDAQLNYVSLVGAMGFSSEDELDEFLANTLSASMAVEASQATTEEEIDEILEIYNLPLEKRQAFKDSLGFDKGVDRLKQAFQENPNMSFDDLYNLYDEIGFDDADVALLRETYPTLADYTQGVAMQDLTRAQMAESDILYNKNQVKISIERLEEELKRAKGEPWNERPAREIEFEIDILRKEFARIEATEGGYEEAYKKYEEHVDITVPAFREQLVNERIEKLNPGARAVYQNAIQEAQLMSNAIVEGKSEDFIQRLIDNYPYLDEEAIERIRWSSEQFERFITDEGKELPDETLRNEVIALVEGYYDDKLNASDKKYIKDKVSYWTYVQQGRESEMPYEVIKAAEAADNGFTSTDKSILMCAVVGMGYNELLQKKVAKATAEEIWQSFSKRYEDSSSTARSAFIGYHIERALRDLDINFGDLDLDGEVGPAALEFTARSYPVSGPYTSGSQTIYSTKDRTRAVTEAIYGESFSIDAKTAVARVDFTLNGLDSEMGFENMAMAALNRGKIRYFKDLYEDREIKEYVYTFGNEAVSLGRGLTTALGEVGSFITSAGGYADNPVSDWFDDAADASRDMNIRADKMYNNAIGILTDEDSWRNSFRGLAGSLPVTLSLLASGGLSAGAAFTLRGLTYAGMAGHNDATFRQFDWYNDKSPWEKLLFVNLYTAPEFGTELAGAMALGGAAKLGTGLRAGSTLSGVLSGAERQAYDSVFRYSMARLGNWGLAYTTEVLGEAATEKIQGELVSSSWIGSGSGAPVDIPWNHIARQSLLLQGTIGTAGKIYNAVDTNVQINKMRRDLDSMLSPQKIKALESMSEQQRMQELRNIAITHQAMTAKTVDLANMHQWALENNEALSNNMVRSQTEVSSLMDQLLDPSLSPVERKRIESQMARELVNIEQQEKIAIRGYHKTIIESDLTDRAALRVRAMESEKQQLEQELSEVSEAYKEGKVPLEKLDFVKQSLETVNEQIAELQPLADRYNEAKRKLDESTTVESIQEAKARLSGIQAELEGTINRADSKVFIEGVTAQAGHVLSEDIAAGVERGDIKYMEQGNTTVLVKDGEIVDVINHNIGFNIKTPPAVPRVASVSETTASSLEGMGYSKIGSADGKVYMVRDQAGVLNQMDASFIEAFVGQDKTLSEQAKKTNELVILTERSNTYSSRKLRVEAMSDLIGIDGSIDPETLPAPLKSVYDKNKAKIDAELANRKNRAQQRADVEIDIDALRGTAPADASMSTEDGRIRLEKETSRWSETLDKKGIKVKIVPEAWLFGNMKDGQGAARWRDGVEIGGKFDGETIYIADTARAEDVTEEFIHAAVTEDLLSNQHTRNKAKLSLEMALAEDPALAAIVQRKVSSYGDLTSGMSASEAQTFMLNESLTEVMKVYIDMADKDASSTRFTNLTSRIREMLGMTTVDLSDGDILSIAERIVDASSRGDALQTKMGVINLDQEGEERGDEAYAMKNWLGGKPVTIEIYRTNASFTESKEVFRQTREFTDYNHFRNFINQTTGNGELLRGGYVSFKMTYQDGDQVKNLYMPKPRVDKEGNLVEMEMNKIGQRSMPWWRQEMLKQDRAAQAREELPNKLNAATEMAEFLGLEQETLQSMVKQWAGEAGVWVGFRDDGTSYISFSKGYDALAAKNVLSNLERYIEDTGGVEAYALWQATQEGGDASSILANVDQNLQNLGYSPGNPTNTAVARMWPTIAKGLGLGGFSVKNQPYLTGARVEPTSSFLATGLQYTYENSDQGDSFKNFFKDYTNGKEDFAQRFAEETSNNQEQLDSQKQLMLDNWGLFSMIVAITSNGSQATRNFDAAVSIFDLYMKAGDNFVEELDSFINVKGVKRTPINGQRLKEVQSALNTLFMTHKDLGGSDEQFIEHMLEPAGTYEAEIPGMGMYGFETVRAQKLFGGKIGAFGGNLLGNEDLIAMDQHFTHEMLRSTGWYPDSPKTNRLMKQVNKAGKKDARLRNKDGSEISNLSELVAAANRLVNDKRGKGGRKGLVKIYGENSAEVKLYDFSNEYSKLLPSGPGALSKQHTVFFHAIAKQTMDEMNKNAKPGEEWTMAAVQQLMFLDNKLVQGEFGVSSAETASFAEVMRDGDINFGGVFGVTGKAGQDARRSIIQGVIDAQEGSILQGVQSLEFNKSEIPVRTSEEIFPDGYKKPKDGKGDSLFKNPTQKQNLSFTTRDGQSNVSVGARDYALVSAINVSFEGGAINGYVTENLNTADAVRERNVEGHEIVKGSDGNYYVGSESSGIAVSAAENVVLANGKIFATGIKVADDLELDITASELAALEEAFPAAFDVDMYAMRRTAARGVSMYADLFDQVNQNPEFFVKPESLNDYKDAMGHLNDSEILTYLNNEALTRLSGEETSYAPLAQIELFNRYTAQGDQDAALLVLRDLSKMGTNVGRMLRQFAELKSSTPEGVKNMILGVGMNNKAKLTDAHKEKADALANDYFGLYNKYLELRKRIGEGEDVETELKDIEKKVKAAEMDINRFVNQISERSWFELARVTAQGNLLTIGSQATNVFANLANVIPTAVVDLTARPMTRLLEKTFPDFYGGKAGEKRKVSFGAYLDGMRGFGAGVKEAFGEIRTGQSADVTEWRQARGYMPIHSLSLAFSSDKLPNYETRTAEMNARAKHLFQGVFGMPAETMFRLLSLGDTPFRRMVERKELSEIGRARGLEGAELQRFIKYPPADVVEQAKSAGLKLTFQEDTSASAVAESTIGAVARGMAKPFQKFEGFDGEDFFTTLIRLNVPYVRTPANILEETLTYASPAVAIARTAKHLAEGDARGASENLAKGVVGQTVTMTTMYLIANGLISGPPDEDPKKRGMQYSSIPPNCINVTALERVLAGGSPDLQDGDVMMNYQKLGLFGSIMGSYVSSTDRNAAAAILQDDESMFAMNNGLSELFGVQNAATIGYMMDQSFLQGLNTSIGILSAGGDPDDIAQAWSKWSEGMFKTASAIVLPNQLSALNRAQRDYMPDFRSDDPYERMANTLRDRTFMTNELPIRYNWKGEPIKQTPGDGGIGYQLIGFSKMHSAEIDDVTRAGVELYSATGDVPSFFAPPQFAQSVFRKQSPPSVSRGKAKKAYERLPKEYNFLENPEEDFTITLNANQINHAIKLACQPRYKELETLVHSEEFKNMSDSERAAAFDKIHQRFNGLLEYDENGDFMPHSLYILDLFEAAYNEQYGTEED